MKNEFAIFDQQSVFFFVMDYLAMIILIVNVTNFIFNMKRKEHKA